jgi:HK97 family phage portal protein
MFDWLLRRGRHIPAPPVRIEKRASAIGRLVFLATGGRVLQRTLAKYETNAREGYQANAVVFRCIRMIADALKATPVQLMQGETDVTAQHPLAQVLAMPNPDQVWEELLDALVGHLYLAGECFIEGVELRNELKELYALAPDKMNPEPTEDGSVGAYVYEGFAGQKRFERRPRQFSPICHLRHWNPTDHWRGLPMMAPAMAAADEHNAAITHARALYENAARPSGALIYAPKEGDAKLSDDQFERLQYELEEKHVGASNAGRPLLLDGGLDWKAMGFSPKDLEAGDGRAAAAREIALALGVPPLLLGLPGDNTFANYYEAKIALWEQAVWPLATFLAKKLTAWVQPLYPGLRIVFDVERSPMAEAAKRDRWERVAKADFLELDEKRAELGYQPLAGGKGKVLLVSAGLSTLEDVVNPPEPDPAAAGLEAYGPEPKGKKPDAKDAGDDEGG